MSGETGAGSPIHLIDLKQDNELPDLVVSYEARKEGDDFWEYKAFVQDKKGEEIYRGSRTYERVTMSNVGSINAITFHYPMVRIVQEAHNVD